MTRPALADDIFSEPAWLAAAVFVAGAATILGALAFQHIGGYLPCALCLMQRTPYYVGVPLAALATVLASRGAAPLLVSALLAAVAALMLYNAGLAVYHAGVEWRFWEGPAGCAPSIGVGSAMDMLNQLENTHAPSCTDAAWRFLGLSFAGWNALIALSLGALSARAAALAVRRQGSSTASQ